MKTRVKTAAEITAMRRAGRILAAVLADLRGQVRAGMTTAQLDARARELTTAAGGSPSFLGYDGFPAAICISINDEIVHGLPSERVIQPGDLVGLDYGVTIDNMVTDAAITVPAGEISADAQRLLRGTEQALAAATAVIRAGVRVGDIGAAIEAVANQHGLQVIATLGGHGVGHTVHEEPFIANFGVAGSGPVIQAGMTLALEPILSLTADDCYLAADGWTYKTTDGSLSAQFEHTVLVTSTGAEILTTT